MCRPGDWLVLTTPYVTVASMPRNAVPSTISSTSSARMSRQASKSRSLNALWKRAGSSPGSLATAGLLTPPGLGSVATTPSPLAGSTDACSRPGSSGLQQTRDPRGRQRGLAQEADRRAGRDQLRQVLLGVRRDQDHAPVPRPPALGEQPSHVEAALPAEVDVE